MNGFNFDYDRVVIETAQERLEKKRRLRRLFSRVFLALCAYIVATYVISIAAYYVLFRLLPPDVYASLENNSICTILISCFSQYVIAFPIFCLMLIGTPKAQKREKSKLSVKDFIVFFVIGQPLIYVGNIIGLIFNNLFASLTGHMPENSVSSLLTDTPMWLIFLMVVVIGPIVEELICRKLMIDRLSIFGDHIAILFSAVSFGLLHANLYQFFYATLLGALLGYVYTKTRDVKYTILMHMLINFMGSVVAIPVEKALNEFYDLLAIWQSGEAVNIFSLFITGTITLIYTNLQYGMIAAGIFALVRLIKKKEINPDIDKEIFLPDDTIIKQGIVNVGAILYLALSTVLTVINLFAA